MKAEITPLEVWTAELVDKPGSLAAKLEALAAAGASLEFVIARRHTHLPGMGVVYVAPLSGAAQLKAARQAGFSKATELTALRLEAVDKKGLGAAMTGALAAADLNLRGLSGSTIGKKAVAFLAFDSTADAKKAMKVLKAAK